MTESIAAIALLLRPPSLLPSVQSYLVTGLKPNYQYHHLYHQPLSPPHTSTPHSNDLVWKPQNTKHKTQLLLIVVDHRHQQHGNSFDIDYKDTMLKYVFVFSLLS